MVEGTVVSAIVEVWTAIVTWMTTNLASVQTVFYNAETGLTFMGVLAALAVGIAVALLLVGIIQNFLRLRS